MAKATKQVKTALLLAGADKVTASKDGTFTARLGYFYTHGNTAAKFETHLRKSVKFSTVQVGNKYRAWPKDSFFWVKLVPDMESVEAFLAPYLKDGVTLEALYKETREAHS